MSGFVLQCIDGSDSDGMDQWAGELARLTNEFRDYLLALAPTRTMAVHDVESIKEYGECGYAFVVAKGSSDTLIGSAWLVAHGDEDDGKDGWIMMVYVQPEYRQQGMGRAMVQMAIDELRKRRAVNVELDVACYNAHASGFYQALGFEPDRIVHRMLLPA